MSVNLIETIQSNLHYPPLQKIDPNTQEVAVDDSKPNEHRFSQSAIPAVLTGLYRYSATDEGAENILRGNVSTGWVRLIFGDTADDVIQKINNYSFQPGGDTETRMNAIAAEAVAVMKQGVKPEAGMMGVKQFFSNQVDTILPYLPEALHMGKVLQDDTLDDNTNKMEGPISSLMHKIGSAFSSPASEEEVQTKK